MFPSAVTQIGADGKSQTSIQPVKDGSDIQSNFFDMWRQEHADADLQGVPGDLVTASGSASTRTSHWQTPSFNWIG